MNLTLSDMMPALFKHEYTRGKLRAMLSVSGVEQPVSFELTNMVDLVCQTLDPSIPITDPKPETVPFTWERLMEAYAKNPGDVVKTMERWGKVEPTDWTLNLRPGSDRIDVGVGDPHMKLELHKVYCEKLGNIWYAKVIIGAKQGHHHG